MKRVTFEVAKAIEKAGYPQECDKVYLPEGIFCKYVSHFINYYAAPTYIEVWLWLWREKKLNIDVLKSWGIETRAWVGKGRDARMFIRHDPEESIIAAIEYLVDNDLIKYDA